MDCVCTCVSVFYVCSRSYLVLDSPLPSAAFLCCPLVSSTLVSLRPLPRGLSAPPPAPDPPFDLRHFLPFSSSPIHPFNSSSITKTRCLYLVDYSIPSPLFLPSLSKRSSSACGFITASPRSGYGSISASSVVFSVRCIYLIPLYLAPPSKRSPRQMRSLSIRMSNTSVPRNIHVQQRFFVLPCFGYFLLSRVNVPFPWVAPIFDGGFLSLIHIYGVSGCGCLHLLRFEH